jgi:hypothetical protein
MNGRTLVHSFAPAFLSRVMICGELRACASAKTVLPSLVRASRRLQQGAYPVRRDLRDPMPYSRGV